MAYRDCKEWTCDPEEDLHGGNIALYFYQQLHNLAWNDITLQKVMDHTAKLTESIGPSVLVILTFLPLRSGKSFIPHRILRNLYDSCDAF